MSSTTSRTDSELEPQHVGKDRPPAAVRDSIGRVGMGVTWINFLAIDSLGVIILSIDAS